MIVTLEDENPNRKWLDLGRIQQQNNEQLSTTVMMVNGTNIDRSLASFDRYQWLDDVERQELHERYATVSMELLAEISIDKPGYLQIMQSTGAGSSAAHFRNIQQQLRNGNKTPLWNRWRGKEKHLNLENDIAMKSETPLRDRLWSSGFSVTSPKGIIKSVDIHDGHIDTVNQRSESMITWPNEITKVPTHMIEPQEGSLHTNDSLSSFVSSLTQDALLVADGFLIPGKDRGGIYVVNNPSNKESEWSMELTDPFSTDRWFYHKAVWVDLTGDGRKSILTARAKLRKVASKASTTTNDSSNIYVDAMQETEMEQNRPKNGQLIWLEMPKPHHYDVETGTPLEEDGTAFDPFNTRHLPWKEHVLATGPDVTFAVADMDPNDDTIEILASQFFDEKVTLHSIKRGPTPEVTFSRVIDDKPGAAFGGILADLDPIQSESGDSAHRPRVIDSGSTIKSLNEGSSFSHFLVTSHEFNSKNNIDSNDIGNNMMITDFKGGANGKKSTLSKVSGGSLLSYKVPRDSADAWKTEPWIRTTIASGFQVKQQIWNVINPGAPGFVYAFHAHKDDEAQGKRPMIAVAGDCAESAYIFRPRQLEENNDAGAKSVSDTNQNEPVGSPRNKSVNNDGRDPQADYKLMCEIKCGATVGSIAVGYDDLCSTEQESGYAKIYIPCFEKDKILVFALGSGEEEDTVELDDFDDSGW